MRECSESLSGRHRWVSANVAAGVYRPECADCHEDGEIGGGFQAPEKRGAGFIEILALFIAVGIAIYIGLCLFPK
jgi:hypothetical protein